MTLEIGTLAGMFFMYGSLAAYFGVKDFVSCLQIKSNTINNSKGQAA